jgi:hypothetical protein
MRGKKSNTAPVEGQDAHESRTRGEIASDVKAILEHSDVAVRPEAAALVRELVKIVGSARGGVTLLGFPYGELFAGLVQRLDLVAEAVSWAEHNGRIQNANLGYRKILELGPLLRTEILDLTPDTAARIDKLLVDYAIHTYNLRMPGITDTISSLADRLEIAEEKRGEFENYILDFAANAARETTGRATAAPRLKWERDRLPDETPAHFAARAYQAEAKAESLHRGLIGQEDKPLAVKLASWLRSHPMPEGIDIPTKPEWITRQAEAGKAKPAPSSRPRTGEQRVYDALASRRYRARHGSPV